MNARLLCYIALAGVGISFTLIDRFLGVSGSSIVILIVLAVGSMLALLPLILWRRRLSDLLVAVAVCGLFIAWIGGHARPGAHDAPYRFQRLYWKIRPGMTRSEIQEVVEREFPKRQPTLRWSDHKAQIILDASDRRYDSELIVVKLRDGRVDSIAYFSD